MLDFRAIAFFNAEYSPQLNPIEQLFNVMKCKLSISEAFLSKQEVVDKLKIPSLFLSRRTSQKFMEVLCPKLAQNYSKRSMSLLSFKNELNDSDKILEGKF